MGKKRSLEHFSPDPEQFQVFSRGASEGMWIVEILPASSSDVFPDSGRGTTSESEDLCYYGRKSQ
jgi:hypothetical protein